MTSSFLDTYALVEVAGGTDKGKAVLKIIAESNETFTGALNLYELWYLTAKAKNEEFANRTVDSIKTLAKIVDANGDVAVIAAKLKKNHDGKKIGAVDFVTAACAIRTGSTVITGDLHFREITETKAKLI